MCVADPSLFPFCAAGNFLTGFFDQIKDGVDGATKGITEGVGNLTSPGKGEGADGAKEEPKDFFSGLVSGITDVAAGAEKAAREVDTSALRSYVCLIAGLIQIPVRPEIVILKPLLGDAHDAPSLAPSSPMLPPPSALNSGADTQLHCARPESCNLRQAAESAQRAIPGAAPAAEGGADGAGGEEKKDDFLGGIFGGIAKAAEDAQKAAAKAAEDAQNAAKNAAGGIAIPEIPGMPGTPGAAPGADAAKAGGESADDIPPPPVGLSSPKADAIGPGN
jgi:hypothetical protein